MSSILSDALRRRSRELGLTNAEVARLSGLNERRYGNYVTGRREPDLRTLLGLAKVLQTTPNDLLGVEDANASDVASSKLMIAVSQLSSADVELLALQAEAIVTFRRSHRAK